MVNSIEAEIVRGIFSRYLELESVHALQRELESQGVRSKITVAQKSGRSRGGEPLNRGALSTCCGTGPISVKSFTAPKASQVCTRQSSALSCSRLQTRCCQRTPANGREGVRAEDAGRYSPPESARNLKHRGIGAGREASGHEDAHSARAAERLAL